MYVVGGDEYDKISYELFTHHQKAQHPRWPPISVKKTFMTLNDINDMSLFEHLFVVAILEKKRHFNHVHQGYASGNVFHPTEN